MIANTVRDSRKRKRPYTAQDFHPMAARAGYDGKPDDLSKVREVLTLWQEKPGR